MIPEPRIRELDVGHPDVKGKLPTLDGLIDSRSAFPA